MSLYIRTRLTFLVRLAQRSVVYRDQKISSSEACLLPNISHQQDDQHKFKASTNESDRQNCECRPIRFSSLVVKFRPAYKLSHVVVEHMKTPLKNRDGRIDARSATQQKKDTMQQTPLSEYRSRSVAHGMYSVQHV